MRVQDLMTRQVATCLPDDSLHHAAQLMWEGDLGCLPVCQRNGSGRIAGIITDRDICMSAYLQRKGLLDMKVSDAMVRLVQVCRPSDSLTEAGRLMGKFRIRRLPVVDESGALIGLIALADLAREAQREQPLQSRQITSNEVGVTLASICQRAQSTPAVRTPDVR